MDKQRYDKGGTAGSKGVQFQVNLSTVFLLNALRHLTHWRLSTEDKRAGKFDDVVLEWPEGTVLLQAKHRENKKKRITVEELMATNSKNDDFSLPKYFFSYHEIKDEFSLKNVIVCTNTSVNEKALKFLKLQEDSTESMLYCAGDNSSFYTCKDDILPELKEKTKIYCEQNLKKKEIVESVVTDENLKAFLEHLQLYFDYPPRDDLEKVIERLLRVTGQLGKVSPLEIYCKVMDWFQQKDGQYLNETQAKAMFSEIRRDKYWQELERYDVFFRNNDLNFQNSKKMYHFKADGASLLQEIRVYRALHGTEKKVLCIYPDDSVEDQKLLLDAFGLRNYVYLIIIWPKPQEERVIKHTCDKIRETLDKYKYKKVILLTDSNNELFRQIELSVSSSIDVTREPPTFQELLKDTQDRLLKKKKIIFQESAIDLVELFFPEKVNEYDIVLSSEILEKLVRNEEIKVGSKLGLLEESIRHLYVPRNLVKRDEKTKEDNIFDVREKTILISDSAGMGKTTILTKLAIIIKEKNPYLWVLRIELSHYSKILKDLLRRKRKTISLLELIDSQEATKLTHPFEKFIFSMNDKVVLMLDGIDEMSPIYTELVMNLLLDCQKAPNLAKILITTRPHLTERLEKNLRAESFTMQPFTKRNQLDFLVTYWTRNLKLNHSHKEKCERYAEALMSKMYSWTKSGSGEGNHFAAVPLHLRMLAEIFQGKNRSDALDWEGCEEFLNADRLEPKLPKRIDISSLYQMFLENKQMIFVDKSNPSGNAIAEQALMDKFDECLVYHRTLALEVILDKKQSNLFTCHKEEGKHLIAYVLSIGIVQEVDNGLHFIHRTFAEYFVAECLLKELQRENQNAEFQKLLIDDILRDFEFKVIRNFFDSLLQNFVAVVSNNIFQNYQSLSYEIEQHKYNFHNVVHELAGEGCVATLQLLLKCVNFRIIKNKETTMYDLYRKVPTLSNFGNRLSILQFFVQRGGLNIRDIVFQTPLHYAARGGHLEMVRFLVEQGARVNVRDRERRTPLYEAVTEGHLDVVKFLVEQKAVVEVKVSQRCNVLYEAITKNHTSIVACLLDKILERNGLECGLDPKYSTVPFAAAYLGRLDILKDLVEKGLNVNCRITNKKPLIFGAAQGGQLETVEYLVQNGANVNNKDPTGNTILHAISNNSSLTSTAEFLVELGIDTEVQDNDGKTALHCAAEAGALKMAELLIKCNANVNNKDIKHNRTILHAAALNDRFKIVRLLAEHSAEINCKDSHGDTVLHSLAKRGKLDAVQCLARFGVDFTVKDNEDNTPLQVALINKQFNVAKFLVQYDSDINSKNKDGQTALHLAVSVSTPRKSKSTVRVVKLKSDDSSVDHKSFHSDILARLDIVRCLVGHNANVNARNGAGQTVLHAAILSFSLDFDFNPSISHCDRCLSVVEFLIDQGAIINLESCNGDVLVVLANELRQNSKYSGKSLEDVWQLPVFRLLEKALLVNNKSGDSTTFDSTSIASDSIVETSELTFNTSRKSPV